VNARKFGATAVKIAGELEARCAALGPADRAELLRLMAAVGGAMRFVGGVQSPELKACGSLLQRLFMAGAALAAPGLGIGPQRAAEVFDATLPDMARIAPTVAALIGGAIPPPPSLPPVGGA